MKLRFVLPDNSEYRLEQVVSGGGRSWIERVVRGKIRSGRELDLPFGVYVLLARYGGKDYARFYVSPHSVLEGWFSELPPDCVEEGQ